MNAKEKLELKHVPDQIIQNTDGSLDLGSDIEAKVSELVGEDISNDLPVKSSSTAAQDDRKTEEKLSLRQQLLKNAPEEKVMRAQVVAKLNKDKDILERGLSKIRGTKNFDLIEELLRELRTLIREIHRVMNMSFEALKLVWLKVVHNF